MWRDINSDYLSDQCDYKHKYIRARISGAGLSLTLNNRAPPSYMD